MSEREPIVRPFEERDIPTISAFLIDSWVTHAKHEPAMLDEQRMKESNVEEYYRKCLENPNSFVFVAENDEQVVGIIRADIEEIPTFFREHQVLFLDDIYVVEEVRHHGIGRLLVKEVEKVAKEKGIKWLKARVYDFNEAAQRLLETEGFHRPHSEWYKEL